MKNILFACLTFSLLFLFTACNKTELGGINGEGDLSYHNVNPYDILFGFTDKDSPTFLFVDNISLYNDAITEAVQQAREFPVTELEVNEIKLSTVRAEVLSGDQEELFDYVEHCELVLVPFSSEEIVLAQMIDIVDGKINFMVEDIDLLSAVKEKSMTLYYRFTYKDEPPTPIEVLYDLNFGYGYSVTWEEDKK